MKRFKKYTVGKLKRLTKYAGGTNQNETLWKPQINTILQQNRQFCILSFNLDRLIDIDSIAIMFWKRCPIHFYWKFFFVSVCNKNPDDPYFAWLLYVLSHEAAISFPCKIIEEKSILDFKLCLQALIKVPISP